MATQAGSARYNRGPQFLLALNSAALLAAGGMLFYTKVYYRRPPITEHEERVRLNQPRPAAVLKTGLVGFDPVTLNISSNPEQPRPADATTQQIQGKLHYATIGFSLEISDDARRAEIETIRARIMDHVISIAGRRTFQDLTTVQGRYLLRGQILDFSNQVLAEGDKGADGETKRDEAHSKDRKDPLVTNVYFTQFIVQ